MKILITLLLFVVAESVLQIDSLHNFAVQQLQDSLIKVTESSANIKILPSSQNQYFSLVVANRHKRKAYQLFKIKYSKLVAFLIQGKMIYSQSTFIKSQLKSRYIARTRLWEYGFAFFAEINKKQVYKVTQTLESLGIKLLKDNSLIKYLEGKWISYRIFQNAKLKLEDKLKQISTQLEIKYVDDIQIDGSLDFQQSDKIESELESEFMEVSETVRNESLASQTEQSEVQINNQIKIEALFRIGKKRDKDMGLDKILKNITDLREDRQEDCEETSSLSEEIDDSINY